MRYNAQQRAYSQALRSSEMAEASAAAHERAFLEARGATDRRGLPARRLWQVEDDATFDALEAPNTRQTRRPSNCRARKWPPGRR